MSDGNHRAAPLIDRQIWIDGEYFPWEKATVHVLSHSHQRGSLIFDYMSVHETPRGPAVFRLPEHVERLFQSADLVGLPLRHDADTIAAAILETVRRNPGARAVKVSAYLASIEVDVVPLDDHVTVAIAAYDPKADVNAHRPTKVQRPETLKLWIEKTVRNRRKDIVPPQAKVAANYTSPMWAKWNARRRGYDEILLVDERGCIAEGPTTNVFLVDVAGTLVTPAEEAVLLGVTRRSILEIARHEGIPVKETQVRPEDLFEAAEVFLTGTTAGVWPVASVDDRPVGVTPPGPIATRLGARFRRITAGEDPDFGAWLSYVNAD
jgi:branched-chain amino acid aminotransferase